MAIVLVPKTLNSENDLQPFFSTSSSREPNVLTFVSTCFKLVREKFVISFEKGSLSIWWVWISFRVLSIEMQSREKFYVDDVNIHFVQQRIAMQTDNSTQDLQSDIDELNELLKQAKRPGVIAALQNDINTLKKKLELSTQQSKLTTV
jgi:hypothetical protein